MGFEKRPDSIKQAIADSDTERLSAAGRKGAEQTNTIKKWAREREEIAALQNEIETERRKLEDTEARESANEHIISPDGDDQDYTPESWFFTTLL